MIFQRGNPLDYERWAADPGMETWSYAHCLPYFKRMEDCTAAAPDDPWRGHGGPLALERGPATSPLFRAWFAAAEEAGYPPTTDVNGYRQEGVAAFDRNIRRGRRWSASRAYLHPVRRRPNLEVRTRTFVTRVVLRRRAGRSASRSSDRAAAPRRILAGEVILAGGAFNSPQLLQLSRRRPGRPSPGRSASTSSRTCRASGEHLQDHLEVYIQYGSQPAGLDAARRDAEVAPAVHRRAVAVPPERARRDEPLRGRRLRPLQRRRRLPEPDVPLPAARDPLRRHGRRAGPRLPGPRRADVLRRPGHACDRARPTRASTRRSASTTSRPTRTGASGSRRSGSPGASSASRRSRRTTTAARCRPGRRVETDDEILAWVARDAETALHPSCTARMGTDPLSVLGPAHDARPRRRRAAGRRRVARCRTSRTATSTRR